MCTGKRQTHIRNAPSSRTAVTGIGPYRVLREFAAAHRADRGVRPYASLGNLTQNRETIVFDRLESPGREAGALREDTYLLRSALMSSPRMYLPIGFQRNQPTSRTRIQSVTI